MCPDWTFSCVLNRLSLQGRGSKLILHCKAAKDASSAKMSFIFCIVGLLSTAIRT